MAWKFILTQQGFRKSVSGNNGCECGKSVRYCSYLFRSGTFFIQEQAWLLWSMNFNLVLNLLAACRRVNQKENVTN